MDRVKGKVAIVTGGALGIGRSACLLLAREGAAVAVTDVLEAEGKKTTDEIVASGGKGFTEQELLDAINSDVLAKWGDGDWSGGALLLADNLENAGKFNWAPLGVGVVIVGGAAGAVAVAGKRRKSKAAAATTAEIEKLEKEAAQQLLTADDGVRAAAGGAGLRRAAVPSPAQLR